MQAPSFRVRRTFSVLPFAFTLALAAASHAGVTLIQSFQELDGQAKASTNTIRVDKDKVRIDVGTNPDGYFIYRADKKLFWNVNLKEKNYMEITEEDFQKMSAKMDEAMAKMQAQMEKMTPEQRQMMQNMMNKMMPGGKPAKTVYTKVGSGGTVNGWSTDKYEGKRDDAKVSEIWTTAPKNLKVDEADVQVFKDMAKFFERFAKNMSGMFSDKSNGLEGVPVKTISLKDGKPHWQMEMKEVKKESFAADLFDVPAGLEKKKMGKMD